MQPWMWVNRECIFYWQKANFWIITTLVNMPSYKTEIILQSQPSNDQIVYWHWQYFSWLTLPLHQVYLCKIADINQIICYIILQPILKRISHITIPKSYLYFVKKTFHSNFFNGTLLNVWKFIWMYLQITAL